MNHQVTAVTFCFADFEDTGHNRGPVRFMLATTPNLFSAF